MALKVRAEGGDGRAAIHMRLCGKDVSITYSDKHLIDLQEMIRSSQEGG